jgi:hypothetical protein
MRTACRLDTAMAQDKAFATIMKSKICFLFKTERLSAGIKLSFHKGFIRSVITDTYPSWEFSAHPPFQIPWLEKLI